MNGNTNPWLVVALILFVTTTTGIGVSIHFYQNYTNTDTLYRDALDTVNELNEAYQNVSSALLDVSYTPKFLIKYENDTEVWYNHTYIPIGWTLFNATAKITDGNVAYLQSSYGIFVTSINGVTQYNQYFWLWYLWNNTSHSWSLGPVGADVYRLRSGEIIAWYLTDDFASIP